VHIDNRATLSGSPPASGRLPRYSLQVDERVCPSDGHRGAAGLFGRDRRARETLHAPGVTPAGAPPPADMVGPLGGEG